MEISRYIEYRELLKDQFAQKRRENSKYSLIYWSRLIGASDAYLKLVLSGKRKLNIDKAKLLAEKIKLNSTETSFFLTLVMKEKSETKELEDYYDKILFDFRKLLDFEYTEITNHKSIFQDSLYWDIYTLAGVKGFTPDIKWIHKIINNPKATENRIRSAIDTLIKLGAFVKDKEGHFHASDIIFKHADSIRSAYMVSLSRAIDHLRNEQKDEKNEYFDSFGLVVSEESFEKIKLLLEESKRKLIDIVKSSDQNKNRIAYYNTNLFYASKPIEFGKDHEVGPESFQ